MGEYIGYKDSIGDGLCNMGLTDEEIIRCRDCKASRENGWKCSRFSEEIYDADQEIGEIVMANVKPNGFCFLAKRRES